MKNEPTTMRDYDAHRIGLGVLSVLEDLGVLEDRDLVSEALERVTELRKENARLQGERREAGEALMVFQAEAMDYIHSLEAMVDRLTKRCEELWERKPHIDGPGRDFIRDYLRSITPPGTFPNPHMAANVFADLLERHITHDPK